MGVDSANTVLCVDDNPGILKLVEAIFANLPAQLVTARDGASGLEIARGQRPCLILLDAGLPDMDGFTFLESLRVDETTSHIPVVIVRGDAMSQENKRLARLGVVDCLITPFDIVEFEHLVLRYLGAQR